MHMLKSGRPRIDLADTYGDDGDARRWSRAFHYFINRVNEKAMPLISFEGWFYYYIEIAVRYT